jgi:PIN like domain
MLADIPPVSELRFFTDRNLGAKILPGILRAAGWNIVTMNELYGAQAGEAVDDVDWVSDATKRGFLLLCSDASMASVPREAEMIKMCGARVFAITRKNAQLRASEQASMYLYSELKIRQLAMREGPYSFAVSRSGLREQTLLY